MHDDKMPFIDKKTSVLLSMDHFRDTAGENGITEQRSEISTAQRKENESSNEYGLASFHYDRKVLLSALVETRTPHTATQNTHTHDG